MKTMGILLILPILFVVIGVESKDEANSRILNGQKSDVLPYQIGIGTGSIYCGGTLIKPDWVLTAEHCLYSSYRYDTPVTVRAGISNAQDEGQSRNVPLDFIIPHDYVDLALLKIDPPFEVNEKVQPIQINDVFEDLVGQEVLISGWGRTTTNRDPKQLSYLKVKITNPEEIPWIARGFFWHIQMLSSNGEGACSGDSGGPAVLGGKNGLLVGVAESIAYFDENWNMLNKDKDEWCGPGVPNDQGHWPHHLTKYVDVFQFADWIKKHTN